LAKLGEKSLASLPLQWRVRRSMCRVRKVDNSIETISNKKCPLSELRCSVVNCVHLKAIHVIGCPGNPLQVFGERADNRSRLFIWGERRTTLIRPVGDRSMTKSGRKQATNIFH
jgi:hypothetical protein